MTFQENNFHDEVLSESLPSYGDELSSESDKENIMDKFNTYKKPKPSKESSEDEEKTENMKKRVNKAKTKVKQSGVKFDPKSSFYVILRIKEHKYSMGNLNFWCTITEDDNISEKYQWEIYKQMGHKHRE